MTFYVENETDETFSNGENSFPIEETVEQVATAVLDMEGCPYEIQLNVLLTDNDGIHAYNKEYRKIDRETDVLSFPNLDFDEPGDFEISEDREADYFDPETGEPLKGVTRQGYSDDSAWARGQAWGIYGVPLNYCYTKNESAFNLFKGMTNYFLR